LIADLQQKYRERAAIPAPNATTACLPNGVNIPGDFEIYNEAFLHEDVPGARFKYQIFIPEAARADVCVACHECEDKCPRKSRSASGCPSSRLLGAA